MEKLEYNIENFTQEDIKTIFQFQYDLALSTENRKLDEKTVTTALNFILKNPKLGTYYISRLKTKEIIGCHMITYGSNLFLNKPVNWFQSVYVPKKHRKKGIFTRMYKNIEKDHSEKKKDLKLFVETDNEVAVKVYEFLGMENKGEIFIERDFYFIDEKIEIIRNQDFKFNLGAISWKENKFCGNSKQNFDLFLNGDSSFFNMRILCREFGPDSKLILLSDVDFENESIIVTVEYQNQIVGYFLASLEISDWRNGLNFNFYDFDVKLDKSKKKEFYESFISYFSGNSELGIKITCVKFIVQKDDLKKEKSQDLLENGFERGHYYLYQKLNN